MLRHIVVQQTYVAVGRGNENLASAPSGLEWGGGQHFLCPFALFNTKKRFKILTTFQDRLTSGNERKRQCFKRWCKRIRNCVSFYLRISVRHYTDCACGVCVFKYIPVGNRFGKFYHIKMQNLQIFPKSVPRD